MLAGTVSRRSARPRGFGFWFFWFRWVLAGAVGGVATLAMMAWLDRSSEWLHLHGLGWIAWAWLGRGVFHAVPQWLVLRAALHRAGRWLLVTAGGLGPATAAWILPSNWISGRVERDLELPVRLGILGGIAFLLALAQCRLLTAAAQRSLSAAVVWLLAGTPANALLLIAPLLIANVVGFNDSVANALALGGLSGAIHGAITGLALVWPLCGGGDKRG
jgi:hypothetical protein